MQLIVFIILAVLSAGVDGAAVVLLLGVDRRKHQWRIMS